MGIETLGLDGNKRYNSESNTVAFFCCLIASAGGADRSRKLAIVFITPMRQIVSLASNIMDYASRYYHSRLDLLTFSFVFSFLTFLSSGALFGYDNGVMGGVVATPGFLDKFFPSISTDAQQVQVGNLYCTYNNQILQLMTSVLFLAGAITEVTGTTAFLTRRMGRKFVMMAAGALFMVAAIILAAAESIAMIVVGRVLQGISVSFASVSVPIYNSECAPSHLRGRFNQLYQIVLTFFILVAQVINLIIHVSHATRWGWRFSLGFAFIPSSVLFFGGIFLPDSPNSLLERGKVDQARRNLEYLRGTKDVDEEFADLKSAADLAATVKNPWTLFFSKKYRPQLVLCCFSTTFQQWTGINIIIFYAPQIFLALGMSGTLSLISAIIIGACNHLSTYISFWTADHFGRRPLFIQAGVQMAIALLTICLSLHFISPHVGNWLAWYTLALLCIFDAAYAWSYGPLAWLYPSEVSPLEIRACGLAAASFCNLLFSFVIAQTFLTMLCSLKAFTFIFFCGCVVVMTTLVYLLFVETKRVPIEFAPFLFRSHWFWKRYANTSIGLQERVVLEGVAANAVETGEVPDDPTIREMAAQMRKEQNL